jgi:NhaP-type Na+/H+ or K+/H+ antiporter
VLVGAQVDLTSLRRFGSAAALLILLCLMFRVAGVFLCFLRSPLSLRERCFSAVASLPKATVQAAIGGLPLAMGLACGNLALALAVVSILLTAPLGAWLIDRLAPRCLRTTKEPVSTR